MSQKGTATELGEQPIGKLLTQYAVPAIIAMTASSLYNMIDSIFIGHGVGAMAISGLAITFPLMNLAAAFGSLVGVGASTLVSVKLGQKDYATAQLILGNVVSLNVLIGIGFTILTLLFLDPILYFFGASEATLHPCPDIHLRVPLGHSGSGNGNRIGTNHRPDVANQALLPQERIAPPEERHLPLAEPLGAEHHRHRAGTVLHEHSRLHDCHPY